LQNAGWSALDAYRVVLMFYAGIGGMLFVLFLLLSPAIEVRRPQTPAPATARLLGLHKSSGVVLQLSALFALDAFAGGFIVQSIMAYWFHVRFAADVELIGAIFFGANLLAGISALL